MTGQAAALESLRRLNRFYAGWQAREDFAHVSLNARKRRVEDPSIAYDHIIFPIQTAVAFRQLMLSDDSRQEMLVGLLENGQKTFR